MRLSIVTTLYHSEPFILEFYQRIRAEVKKITDDYEIIFVNDGSPDRSTEKVLEFAVTDNRITLIELSRNFGHHRAIVTGLQYTTGDFVFLIDSDLEEEPELLGLLWEKLQTPPGADVVYGVQKKRKGKIFEKNSGRLFYSLFGLIAGFDYPADTLTARIMSKQYVESLRKWGEKEMDLWGIFMLNGFTQEGLTVTKRSKGSSTYTFRKKVKMAIYSITSLTNKPLYFIFFLGLLLTLLSLIAIVYILIDSWIRSTVIDLTTWVLLTVWLIGGTIMFTLGIIAIYISKIYLEVKNRPLSVIKKIYRQNDEERHSNKNY
jgi:putative glycosyltransferase